MSIQIHHEQASLFGDDASTRRYPRHVLSYGLGLDSRAVLLRWLTDPASRDFDVSDLKFASSALLISPSDHIGGLLGKLRDFGISVYRCSAGRRRSVKVDRPAVKEASGPWLNGVPGDA